MSTTIVVPNNQIVGANVQATCDNLTAVATEAAADINSILASVGTLQSQTLVAHYQQSVAASLSAQPLVDGAPVRRAGTISAVTFISSTAAHATDESMTVDVLKNGVSILTAVLTFNSTKSAKSRIACSISGTPTVVVGDVLTCTRVYTAGSSPSMTSNVVEVLFQ